MDRANDLVTLGENDRVQLPSMARSRSLAPRWVRAHAPSYLTGDGLINGNTGALRDVSKPTVPLWPERPREQGLAGLYDELPPALPRAYDDHAVAQAMRTVLHPKPPAAVHGRRPFAASAHRWRE